VDVYQLVCFFYLLAKKSFVNYSDVDYFFRFLQFGDTLFQTT